MKTARQVAYEVLYKIEFDEAYSSILLNNSLKEENLSNIDSAFASAIIYGVLEKRLTIDYVIRNHSSIRLKKIENRTLIVLRMGAYQLLFMNKVPASAAVNESVVLAKSLRIKKSVPFVNAVLRSISRDSAALDFSKISDRYKQLSLMYSVPQHIIKMWCEQYGTMVTVDMLKVLDGRPALYARVNTLKNSADELIKILGDEGVKAEKTALDTIIKLKSTGAVEKLQAFQSGRFYIQDLSSNTAVTVLSPKESDTVLDVCAAPGGKSFSSAMLMSNRGKIMSFDLYEHRVKLIGSMSQRLGTTVINAQVRNALDEYKGEKVQTVICDVPCSGLGLMRRKPEIRYKDDILDNDLPDLQYKILCESAQALKNNGRLMYSTCTLNPAENSCVVKRFLEEHTEFQGEEIVLPNGIKRTIDEEKYECTLFPQTNDSDGFYFAILKCCR